MSILSVFNFVMTADTRDVVVIKSDNASLDDVNGPLTSPRDGACTRSDT